MTGYAFGVQRVKTESGGRQGGRSPPLNRACYDVRRCENRPVAQLLKYAAAQIGLYAENPMFSGFEADIEPEVSEWSHRDNKWRHGEYRFCLGRLHGASGSTG